MVKLLEGTSFLTIFVTLSKSKCMIKFGDLITNSVTNSVIT